MSIHTKASPGGQPESAAPRRILFVCLGNICRSPAAEIIFNAVLEAHGRRADFEVDSCGMGAWHVGQKPDARMLAALQRHGYRWGGHRARQFRRADFADFDLIIPQDASNREDILALARSAEERARVQPMSRWFLPACRFTEVPDPYWDGERGFDTVVELLEEACTRLAEDLLG